MQKVNMFTFYIFTKRCAYSFNYNVVGAYGFSVNDEQRDRTSMEAIAVDEHLQKVYASVIFKLQPSILCLLHY